jgi:hypothetical protein
MELALYKVKTKQRKMGDGELMVNWFTTVLFDVEVHHAFKVIG